VQGLEFDGEVAAIPSWTVDLAIVIAQADCEPIIDGILESGEKLPCKSSLPFGADDCGASLGNVIHVNDTRASAEATSEIRNYRGAGRNCEDHVAHCRDLV